jgi:hypothetical protein
MDPERKHCIQKFKYLCSMIQQLNLAIQHVVHTYIILSILKCSTVQPSHVVTSIKQ